VQEGVAFCPQCNAPQIRVAVPEPMTPLPAGLGVESASRAFPYFSSRQASGIDWSQALPATALAGFIAAILMMTPLAAVGLGMLIGGSLSVVFYRRRSPVANITPGIGTRLGLVSGVLGGCVFSVMVCVQAFLRHDWGEIRQKVVEVIEQAAARNPDPQAQQAVEFLKTDQGVALIMTSGMVIMLIALVVLSGLGGALCAAVLRRRSRTWGWEIEAGGAGLQSVREN
jgi:hypothetical protein